MIWIILASLAILDTIIGNRIFPSRVGVVRIGDTYSVYKYNRILFVPFKMWVSSLWTDLGYADRHLVDFGSYSNRGCDVSKDKAIRNAEMYANQIPKKDIENMELVWVSRRNKAPRDSEEELTLQLGQALIEGRKEDEVKIMLRLKELNYI